MIEQMIVAVASLPIVAVAWGVAVELVNPVAHEEDDKEFTADQIVEMFK